MAMKIQGRTEEKQNEGITEKNKEMVKENMNERKKDTMHNIALCIVRILSLFRIRCVGKMQRFRMLTRKWYSYHRVVTRWQHCIALVTRTGLFLWDRLVFKRILYCYVMRDCTLNNRMQSKVVGLDGRVCKLRR
jgi:hypothetical protein